MIDTVCAHVLSALNERLARRLDLDDGPAPARLGPLPDPESGEGAARLLLSVFGVERETAAPATPRRQAQRGDAFVTALAPLHLNLGLMISAHGGADTYADGLRLLSEAMLFFEALRAGFAGPPPPGIEKLGCDLAPLDTEATARIWAGLGGAYRPSALYRLRMVTLADETTVPVDLVRKAEAQVFPFGEEAEATWREERREKGLPPLDGEEEGDER